MHQYITSKELKRKLILARKKPDCGMRFVYVKVSGEIDSLCPAPLSLMSEYAVVVIVADILGVGILS